MLYAFPHCLLFTATCHNNIEIGDKLHFTVKNDVYKNNKLIIKKGAPAIGIVGYLNENGWSYDNAEITLETFKLKDINGKVITINEEVKIDGFETIKKADKIIQTTH